MSRHENYEILNLIGYGLAKFDGQFERIFGCSSKSDFYQLIVDAGVAETVHVVKNRRDLFDPYFDNSRAGWWQKKELYVHRKDLIDSLFGDLDSEDYASVVSQHLKENFGASIGLESTPSPIQKSRYKQLQETGLEAELYFSHNFQLIQEFDGGTLEDARLFGDGYDFQITFPEKFLLAEIKGVRAKTGGIRMTEREYLTAQEYAESYSLVIVSSLDDVPKMTAIPEPLKELKFSKQHISSAQTIYSTSDW